MQYQLIFFTIFVAYVVCIGDLLVVIPQVTCQNEEIILQVKKYIWDVDGEITFTTRAYFINDIVTMPGSTIVMKAGTQCNITISNELDETSGVADCHYHMNVLHCPDTTNLHTHGLHVSPYQDLINSYVLPGEKYTYTYDIPENHLMGTHWYHAHNHGSTSLHTNGGMAGLLLMDPADSYILKPELAALYENNNVKYMIIHHVNFAGTDVDHSEAFTFLDYQAISDAFLDANEGIQTIDPNVTLINDLNELFVVNGQYQPYIEANIDEVFLMRIVYSGGFRIAELELSDSNCEMKLLARDGIFQYTPYQTITGPTFVPGTRADIAVKCSTTGSVIASFKPDSSRDALGTENRATQEIVFTIEITADTSINPITTFPIVEATLPSYLNDITGDEIVLSVGSQGVSNIEFTLADNLEMINNVPFPGFEAEESERYVERICLNEVYEFSGTPPAGQPPGKKRQGAPATGAHPYHQHVNHFQIIDINGVTEADPDIIRVGEWRDVIPLFAPNGVNFRFQPHDFIGDTVLHCHLLQHEDNGMMGLFDISDCSTTDTNIESTEVTTNNTTKTKNILHIIVHLLIYFFF